MKNKKDFPFMALFISAVASILVLLPLRVYQYFEVLEIETGFYKFKDFSVYAMYGIMAFVVIFSIAVSLINKKSLKNTESVSSVSDAAFYLIAALGFVVETASKAMLFAEEYNSYIYSFNVNVIKHLTSGSGLIYAAQAVFALISALYFFALAIGSITKKDVAHSLKIIALAPSVWAAIRLLYRFKSTISFTNVSDLLIELCTTVFMMMFFFAFAQSVSKVDKGESFYKIFAYGIPAAVFGITCFIPRAVLSVVGHADLIASGYGIEVCDLTVPILIFSVLISKINISAPSKVKK